MELIDARHCREEVTKILEEYTGPCVGMEASPLTERLQEIGRYARPLGNSGLRLQRSSGMENPLLDQGE